jgi:hypothetical protein
MDLSRKRSKDMSLSKSIDFLLENAGCVIQYRLRKEILNNITKAEEKNLLEQIYNTPHFKLVQSYAKPNGYIGNSMHGGGSWRGVSFHETPLQDGEHAARLLSLYAIPKTHPIVANFVSAMRNEDILREEFKLYPAEEKRFEKRYNALNSGSCLMGLMYTMQAMLGFGDDYDDLLKYQETCLKGFKRILGITSFDEITRAWNSKSNRYNYRIVDVDEYFPTLYTLTFLAYTKSWRTPENIKMLADSLNHLNKNIEPCEGILIKSYDNYIGLMGALTKPIEPFKAYDVTVFRKTLTEIAMLGVGESVDVIKESAANVYGALDTNGILRMDFGAPHNKHYSPKNIKYSSGYGDVRLEPYYEPRKKIPVGLLCDLTFWAVQFLHLSKEGEAL